MSLHNGTERKSTRSMRKPLTSKDREHYVHKLRAREGRIAWTVRKTIVLSGLSNRMKKLKNGYAGLDRKIQVIILG